MSKLAELAYDIEQLFIEGYSPKTIAAMLECPLTIVYDWLESNGIEQYVPQDEEYSPYNGA
jgi:DNA invertase Pin-like site-specific DNA recombinase